MSERTRLVVLAVTLGLVVSFALVFGGVATLGWI